MSPLMPFESILAPDSQASQIWYVIIIFFVLKYTDIFLDILI
jgi:hypothetical protein